MTQVGMTAFRRAVFAAVGGAALATALAASAFAQTDQDRRLDRMEKDLREIRAIVFQGRDTGQPVVVKPEGPDPAVEALQSRMDQLEQSLTTLRGQVEVMSHDVDEAKRQNAAAHDAETELRGEVKELSDQIAKLQAPAAQAEVQPPPPAPTPDQSAPPAAQGAGGEGAAFKAAKAQLAGGDYQGAGDSLNAYLQQYGSSPHAREAYYLLGESYYVRSLYGDATTAYARALKDWPKTWWAPDATVKLSRALVSTNRTDQACAALGEFNRRYDAAAPKAVKARAAATAAAAKCPA
jgi:tol-pal system protein YbgF